MRTTRQLPERIVLFLVFQFIIIAGAFPQNKPGSSVHTFVPLPKTLVSSQGLNIETPVQWEEIRRPEILKLFRDHVYGHVPESASGLSISYEVKFLDLNALGGTAIQKEVEVQVNNGLDTLSFSVLVYLPKEHSGPVPLFVGLNFNGNHTIHPDEQISLTESWVRNNSNAGVNENRAIYESRGLSASRWPVDLILSRGYGIATIYCGEIDPDFHDGFNNGIHALFPENSGNRDLEAWGTISAWAWGLSRAMDYFEDDADIDHQRVAVFGHSRLGKTSLWAGAQDERFALVISNNSGCGGAALSRRAVGERVTRINTSFPHWFASRFHSYNDNEDALPVDQHMLMALMAPRPLYVASAEEDEWADPYGEYLSLYYGSEVYELYGNNRIESDQLPGVDQPQWSGALAYHIRTGKHNITKYDWEQYLDFADENMGAGNDGRFENPVSVEWIRENLEESTPRLVLTPELESLIKARLEEGDEITEMGLKLLRQHAESILELQPLMYKKEGRRLLGVSREAIRRLTTLALAYRLEKDERYLKKLEEELKALCAFKDWNPSHFLDVAEMAAGIALALDWAGDWISMEVNQLARDALVKKAIKPGLAASPNNWWINTNNNWNLVCHGGLSLAALTVFEDEPEMASRILHQAVEKIPLALEPYAPGGIYPEGPSYWFYATTYLTVAVSAFESAFGTDFGFTHTTGLAESAVFSQVMAGPSGKYYNYFDASLDGFQSLRHFGLLCWFALRSGSGLEWKTFKDLLGSELSNPQKSNGDRYYSTHFLNTVLLDRKQEETFSYPEIWSGGGGEPIAVIRDSRNDNNAFFLAAKGGRAADNHGNMDAGSFIFELEGIRWSVDPGNQSYNELEQLIGGALWDESQDSPRWTLLTKNNFGHSTLTVNEKMHLADARATLIREDRRTYQPRVTFDLTPIFGENLKLAHRTFIRVSDQGLRIKDHFLFSPQTETLTWQMITQAEVKVKGNEVLLQQEGKKLHLMATSEAPVQVKLVQLSPPPLSYDKNIRDLKRIEFRMKRSDFPGNSGEITVDLYTVKKKL